LGPIFTIGATKIFSGHNGHDFSSVGGNESVVEECQFGTLAIRKEINVKYVRFEVFTEVTIKNGVFWDVTPCGSCKNQNLRFSQW
jgi:hypothetical protein